VGELGHLAHKLFRIPTKREVDSPGGAKKIGDDREIRSFHVCEKKRWAASLNDPSMDLRNLQIGIYLGGYLHELVLLTEDSDKILDGTNTFSLRHTPFHSIIPKVQPYETRRWFCGSRFTLD
jgi:hypothetical protein